MYASLCVLEWSVVQSPFKCLPQPLDRWLRFHSIPNSFVLNEKVPQPEKTNTSLDVKPKVSEKKCKQELTMDYIVTLYLFDRRPGSSGG